MPAHWLIDRKAAGDVTLTAERWSPLAADRLSNTCGYQCVRLPASKQNRVKRQLANRSYRRASRFFSRFDRKTPFKRAFCLLRPSETTKVRDSANSPFTFCSSLARKRPSIKT